MKTKVLVATLNEIDVLGSRRIKLDGTEIAVFRLSDDSVLAVENLCPHKQGLLSEGMVCGTTVHCPLHDWKIDLHSGKVQAPDEGCVNTYETEVDPENGSIYISV
ncbi:nitrite reductase small subunit NirD [Paenibacillus sp. HB172176]|uniref:nitrite reductase small subunit NirD n=1 Tax=Paenibacillus sp. HB172176 TaxID=2493690 RepID=UPI001439AD8C|nr:nitrite reductase small subunit NirD [Paenibacillus sp. HB172176]